MLGRINFDWHSPGASAGAPGESVPAEAGDVAGAGRPGKPLPAFTRGQCLGLSGQCCPGREA